MRLLVLVVRIFSITSRLYTLVKGFNGYCELYRFRTPKYNLKTSNAVFELNSRIERGSGAWFEDDNEGFYETDGNNNNNKFIRDENAMLDELEDRVLQERKETCILVGVEDLSLNSLEGIYYSLKESMIEMRELIKTAGLEIVGEITQRLKEANPKTYIGTGKVKEVDELARVKETCTVVFDAEISPRQQKALENAFNSKALDNDFMGSEKEIKVIDRTALILDIFAQHAKTREGKLQVDLALHEYRKPRLTRMWTHLERQSGAGGVGLRGPGELQLEIDKRLIADRIFKLKQKINAIGKQRQLHRKKRSEIPILSLVGYTNAGKSTLLNSLTRAGVMAENILFATLDPTTRRVKLPFKNKNNPEILMTDTVGFIQKLPTNLIAAFRATLEEVHEADVIVHLIDASHPSWEKQEASVNKVLSEIDISTDKPVIRLFNKIDLLQPYQRHELNFSYLDSPTDVAISAKTGEGIQDFVSVIELVLDKVLFVPIQVQIPYENGDEINLIHKVGNVDTIDYRPTGTYISCRVPQSCANRLERFRVNEFPKSSENQQEQKWTELGRGRHTAKE